MLTIYVGLPGSGKTTFYEEMDKTPHTVYVSLDWFRMNVLGHEFHAPSEPIVHAWAKQTTRYLLSLGYDVVLDATHLRKSIRRPFIELAHEYLTKVRVYEFQTTLEEALERNAKRDRNVPEEVIVNMAASYEQPHPDEGMDELIYVPSDGNVKKIEKPE
jgi:predicted kinase